MRTTLTRGLLFLSLLVCAGACNATRPLRLMTAPAGPATQPGIATGPHRDPQFHVDMRRAVTYLASDELEGRMVGTPGIQKAADYIADAFSKLDLQTFPGMDGYFQPFKMVTRVDPDNAKTSLIIAGRALKLGQDYTALRVSSEGSAIGPLAFAGYGITDAEHHYDDYANLDVKGKVVLVMRYEPITGDGKSRFATGNDEWSVDATIPQKVQTAVGHGAVGVILVNPPLHHEDDQGLIPFSRRYPFGATLPVMQVTVDVADALVRPLSGDGLRGLQAKLDATTAPASSVVPGATAKMAFAVKQTEKQVENVAALLPGTGPHADEYVVIGAHYDHLGHGGPGSLAPWSHGIHHGADDNASGTAAVMELADRFVHLGPQPRSLIFIAFTGEEEGLIGSEHFVAHPPVPLDKIVAMLNLDMVGRVSADKLLIGAEHTAPIFPDLLKKADQGLPLKLGEFGGGGGMGPSDHMSFALRRIPVLFLFSGLHLDYHRPTDTADKINYQGMAEVVDFAHRVIQQLTTMPRQKYDSAFDTKGLMQLGGPSSSPHGGKASLGAIPDYSQGEDAKGGMRIGGIVPGSPAEQAGLKAGDIVTDFNGTRIENMMDYTAALGKAKPGTSVKLKVLRGAQRMEVQATLAKRKE